MSKEQRQKLSIAHTGKKLSESHKRNIRLACAWYTPTSEHKRKISVALKGHKVSIETRRKLSESLKGYKAPLWKGGLSFITYPETFSKLLKSFIMSRDGNICQACGTNGSDLQYKLHCHHIDYNKHNNNPCNLILLCRSCHAKTSIDRVKWSKIMARLLLVRLLNRHIKNHYEYQWGQNDPK